MRYNAEFLTDQVKDTGLTDDELKAYAVVHSATKGPRRKEVTSDYVAQWLGCSEFGAWRALKSLVSKGLIVHGWSFNHNGRQDNFSVAV